MPGLVGQIREFFSSSISHTTFPNLWWHFPSKLPSSNSQSIISSSFFPPSSFHIAVHSSAVLLPLAFGFLFSTCCLLSSAYTVLPLRFFFCLLLNKPFLTHIKIQANNHTSRQYLSTYLTFKKTHSIITQHHESFVESFSMYSYQKFAKCVWKSYWMKWEQKKNFSISYNVSLNAFFMLQFFHWFDSKCCRTFFVVTVVHSWCCC